MNFKRLAIGAALGASMMSGVAAAGVTGNVGVFSEYLFRGVEQTNGAAIQGGLDYASKSGLYAGVWISNVNFGGGGPLANAAPATVSGNEVDLYGGYTLSLGGLGLDIGGIAYIYSENEEVAGAANIDTFEVYLGASFGPVAAKAYFTPDAAGTGADQLYATATATFPVKDSVSAFVQLGNTSGQVNSYMDYSAGVTKSLDGGTTLILAVTDTDGLDVSGAQAGDMKFTIGAKKSFDF